MYAFIWEHLPGNRLVKSICALALFLGAVWVLFTFVFPRVEGLSPFGNVTVDRTPSDDASAASAEQ